MQEDPRLLEAKAIPIAEVAARLGIAGLRHMGEELVGPCPLCGGRDRFAINTRKGAFQCRKCGIAGGDQVELVREIANLGFRDALTFLCGDAPVQIDPAEMERRRARAAEADRQRLADGNRYRQQAIADARSIWSRAGPDQAGIVRDYLAARGITPDLLPALPSALRFLPDHPYVKKVDRALETMHRGPCMIAGVLDPKGHLTAVHQTWIDLAQPKGKARVTWNGDDQPAKMVRGSKKGAAIRLATPEGADTLVMGEGIETTLTALVADAVPGAAYWAGVDLGNMSGRMQRIQPRTPSGMPDMTDTDAFVPPPWVRRLVFIQDGDSAPGLTRAKLLAGLRRAMAWRPGLCAQIVHAGEGLDLNDLLVAG